MKINEFFKLIRDNDINPNEEIKLYDTENDEFVGVIKLTTAYKALQEDTFYEQYPEELPEEFRQRVMNGEIDRANQPVLVISKIPF